VKVLLDEMLPISVREFLPSHEVYSAAHAGFSGISNGEMIRRAIEAGFDIIVTLDRGIPHQQNLERPDLTRRARLRGVRLDDQRAPTARHASGPD